MSIKMKDDFELPVKKTPGGVMPFLKDAAGDVIFVGSDKHVRAAAVAINAYDANQQEIAELTAHILILRTFCAELSIEDPEKITRPTGRYCGDETYDYIDATWIDDAKNMLNNTKEQCLKSVRLDAKLSGAIGFKDEMISASTSIFSPHIEGVFAVYEIKLREGKS